MSDSQSNPLQLQLNPETQAFFECILNEQLQEQERLFLHEVQKREMEMETKRLEREREVVANDATLRQALESAMAQLALQSQ